MLLLGRLIFHRSACKTVLPWRAFIARKPIRSASVPADAPDGQKKDRVWTIPNILTFTRIGSSPILGYLIVNHHYPAALSLFIVSGLTDLLDGWIARRYPSQASALGSFLDPLADKILVGIVVISLAYVHLLPLWLLALILSRDIVIMIVAAYLRVKSVPPPRTLKKILDMKNATVQLYPTFISKVRHFSSKASRSLDTSRSTRVSKWVF
jgi:cardiolipin synthase (CMP-forming)